MGCRLHDLQLRRHACPHALHFQQPLARRGDHLGETAEAGQQGLGHGLGVAPRQGGEQGEFQQFIVRHRLGAALEEARPQTFAVAGMHSFHRSEKRSGILNASNAL